ncbi:hypothetical protein CES87_25170 [Pseudomonas sp. ERMR1:02]|nr:hypothetical protein CES87_25170 [Pseudomonas sp. ERMR1:02]
MPAKNDNAVYLFNRVIVLRGQASLLQIGGHQKVRPVMFRNVECAPFLGNRRIRLAFMGG